MDAFAAAVHERFGGVDLLINNAGIGVGATFAQTELEDWERQLQINVMGVVHGCRSFVPHMIERGSGQIVNVSSGAGFLATPFMLAYSATKFAVFGLSEGLRMELRPHGIGVTTVCPGFINTPIIGDQRHARRTRRRAPAEAHPVARASRLRPREGRGPDPQGGAAQPRRRAGHARGAPDLRDVAGSLPRRRAGWPRGRPPPSTDQMADLSDIQLEPPLTQVAFSVVDLAATERWFREGLGFWPAGGSRRMMRGPLASAVQGLPRVASTCWWMVDRNEWFQLEMFQFERPLARLMAHDVRPCDIGYTRIGVWVADFDQTLTRLARLGSSPLSDPVGPAGARRACVRNPDGVYVEIMEDDPLAGAGLAPSRSACPVAVRSVTLSVPDLARSEAFFSRGLGLERSDAALRAPEHEALWGLAGAQTRSGVFTAGSVLVEVVQYLDPVGRPRPAGLPDL